MGHLLSQNLRDTRTELHLIELLAKGVPWKSPNNPGCCQDYKLLSTNWQQGPVPEDYTHTTHWTWRDGAGTYIESSPLCSCFFGIGRYSAGYQKKNVYTNATKPLICNAVLPENYAREMMAQSLWEWPTNIWFDFRPIPLMRKRNKKEGPDFSYVWWREGTVYMRETIAWGREIWESPEWTWP